MNTPDHDRLQELLDRLTAPEPPAALRRAVMSRVRAHAAARRETWSSRRMASIAGALAVIGIVAWRAAPEPPEVVHLASADFGAEGLVAQHTYMAAAGPFADQALYHAIGAQAERRAREAESFR